LDSKFGRHRPFAALGNAYRRNLLTTVGLFAILVYGHFGDNIGARTIYCI